MRFNDEQTCTVHGFRQRLPVTGALVRWAGWLALVAVAAAGTWDPPLSGAAWGACLALIALLWGLAWYLAVGALHRAPLVAAALVVMVQLTRWRWEGLA